MHSHDFIGLESSSANNSNGVLEELESKNSEMDYPTRLSYEKKDNLFPENGANSEGDGGGGDDLNVLDMKLEEGIDTQYPVLYETTELFGSSALEKSDQVMVVVGDATLISGISNNLLIDESSIKGVKRARTSDYEKQPSVHVIFHSLTRESKRKLMELMQQWSQWQADNQLSSSRPEDVLLEDGEETYFPALHLGTEKSNAVIFWIDNQARQEVDKVKALLEADVPFYDRGYTLGSNSVDGSSGHGTIETLEASRCFNCGSYSHSLKECPKPHDNVAINNARKMHNSSKRNPTDRAQVRYYQKTTGKFDDLCAGVLGAETRRCLGIGENDPPPWLHRMQEIGYPPGYLDDDEDEDLPSGITIFADETKQEFKDGELPERCDLEPPRKKMSVAFPGINAPIPDNADSKRWGTLSFGSCSNSSRNRVHRSSHSSDHHKENHHEQRRSSDLRDNSMPTTEHGFSLYSDYSPRYHPNSHNSSSRSSNLGRSLYERGWDHPLPFETSPIQSPHNPYPYSSALQSPRDHYWNRDHWSSESLFRWEPDYPKQDRYDYHHHRHHHHHHHQWW
ncbi:uncharacterized protein LOC141847773 [Curcuma longa]|uniref:uncharacterized protein LOC141847773 n=1 Tax=Curcuma longa TaxID=136217 RepID=UPI003D9F6B07